MHVHIRECYITVNGYKTLAFLCLSLASQRHRVLSSCAIYNSRAFPRHFTTLTHTTARNKLRSVKNLLEASQVPQIKRETQLKHLAINSFISMSHKQCYRCQAVAVAASVEVEIKVEATAAAAATADWRALRLHYTLLQLLRSNFMSFLGTKSYKTARNCQPFEERLLCSARLCSTLTLCSEAIIAC